MADDFKALMKNAYSIGFEHEKNFHGCAQCTIGALYEVFPKLRNEDIFKSASGMGGGVGLTCLGHCGALSGGVMVLSQIYGRELHQISDPERKRAVAFKLGEKLVSYFLDEYGTIICHQIQEKIMGRSFRLLDSQDKKIFEAMGGHMSVCPAVVGKGVQWTLELIEKERAKKNR